MQWMFLCKITLIKTKYFVIKYLASLIEHNQIRLNLNLNFFQFDCRMVAAMIPAYYDVGHKLL